MRHSAVSRYHRVLGRMSAEFNVRKGKRMGHPKLLNRKLSLVLFAVTIGHVAQAKSIETAMFSIEVPSQWEVEDNKSDVILVMGNRLRDRTPMPFLSVQYCATKLPNGAEATQCDEPCSEKSLAFLKEDDSEGFQTSAVVNSIQQDGSVQFKTELIASPEIVGFMVLSCSDAGQVYLSLTSDQPQSEAKRVFNSIVSSLKWK